MNVPKLRFKEFNDEYIQKDLSEISIMIKDGTHGTHENYQEGIPLLSAKDINNNKINIPKDCRKISAKDFNKIYKNYSLIENDVLLTIVGTIGRTALYKNEKVAFQRSVASIRIDNNNNSNYIKQYTESPKILNQLNNMTNSSAQGGVYLSSLSKLKFGLPTKKEQIKVSNFLSLLDKKIELQTKKIEDLKLFKLYTENNLLNSDDSINWKETKLSDILIEGNKIPVKNTSDFKKITIKLNLNGLEFNETKREMSDKRPFYIREENEIIIGKQNYFNGSIAIVTKEFAGCICSNAIMSFNVKEEFDLDYVYLYLSQKKYMKQREFLANGTGQKELSEKEFLKFTIKIPDDSTIKKIISIINVINKKINLENNKLSKLIEQKKGLTQKMFV